MDQRGKFAWQNLVIIGLVVVIVAFAMGWIKLDGEGDSDISLYIQTEDGQLIPIGGGKTMSIQALSIYYNGEKIQGITGILNLKPVLSGGDDASVAIHWTGSWKITGFIKGTNTVIFQRPEGYWPKAPDPTNIPTNVWTALSDYPAAFTEPELPSLTDGDYTFVWGASGTASHGTGGATVTAEWSIVAHVDITKTANTLSISIDIIRSSFDVLS